MKKNLIELFKSNLVGIIGVAVVIIGALLILAFSGNDAISGKDALMIAASQFWYWAWVIITIAGSVIVAVIAIKCDMTGMGVQLLCVVLAAIIAVAVVGKPANIKADPIGSGASTEQINYLRGKGLK